MYKSYNVQVALLEDTDKIITLREMSTKVTDLQKTTKSMEQN